MPEAQPIVVAPSEPCARCGRDSDFEIAALWLCVDCYHVAGSTCAGIGRMPTTAPSPGAGAGGGAGGGAGDAPGPAPGPADQVC